MMGGCASPPERKRQRISNESRKSAWASASSTSPTAIAWYNTWPSTTKMASPTPLGPALGLDREVEAAARPAVDLDVLALAEFGALHVGDRVVDRTVEYLIGVVVHRRQQG